MRAQGISTRRRGGGVSPFPSLPLLTFDGEGIWRTLMSRFSVGLVLLIFGAGASPGWWDFLYDTGKNQIGPIAIEFRSSIAFPIRR